MASLDVEKEEVYESRVYRFRPGPEAFSYLMNLITSQQLDAERPLSQEEIYVRVAELMEDVTFKFLAKRRKEDGLISTLLVAVAPDSRRLLNRYDWMGETKYRQAVEGFEQNFLPKGVVSSPMVITLDEWRRYSQNGPSSEHLPPK